MKVFPIILLLLISTIVKAQNEPTRTFAINVLFGGVFSNNIRTTTPNDYLMPQRAKNSNALLNKLQMEYYIPFSSFSLKAGYEHEEYNFMNVGLGKDMNLFSLGTRYYPLNKTIFTQPYVGLDLLYNHNGGSIKIEGDRYSSYYNTTHYEGVINKPRFNIAPVVGVDFYVFSSIALQFEYGYRIGIGRSTNLQLKYNNVPEPFELSHRLNRHNISMGLKIVFPFHFNRQDEEQLIDNLFDSLLNNKNNDYRYRY